MIWIDNNIGTITIICAFALGLIQLMDDTRKALKVALTVIFLGVVLIAGLRINQLDALAKAETQSQANRIEITGEVTKEISSVINRSVDSALRSIGTASVGINKSYKSILEVDNVLDKSFLLTKRLDTISKNIITTTQSLSDFETGDKTFLDAIVTETNGKIKLQFVGIGDYYLRNIRAEGKISNGNGIEKLFLDTMIGDLNKTRSVTVETSLNISDSNKVVISVLFTAHSKRVIKSIVMIKKGKDWDYTHFMYEMKPGADFYPVYMNLDGIDHWNWLLEKQGFDMKVFKIKKPNEQ